MIADEQQYVDTLIGTALALTRWCQQDQAALACRGAVLAAFGEVEDALSEERGLGEQVERVTRHRDLLQRSLVLARGRCRADMPPTARNSLRSVT